MPTYIVSYDLNKAKNYQKLYDAIQSYENWWHHLDSTWVIVTYQSAVQVRDNLGQHVDADDKLLVVRTTRDAAWKGFNDTGSKWLNDNL